MNLRELFSRPMTSGEGDYPVGVDELGRVVYSTPMGDTYTMSEASPRSGSVIKQAWGALKDRPVETVTNALAGAAQGAWDGVSAPGRAAAGEPVTYGDVAATAMDWGLVNAPGIATARYAPDQVNMGIRAYHGSPHDFDRFSMNQIGTGEGAQAYGYGLYFAEAEDVAKMYRDALAPPMPTDSLRAAGVGDGDIRAIHQFTQSGTNPEIALRDWLGWTGRSETPELRAAFMDSWNGKNPGHLYEVDINADQGDFLDWDAPLSEQPDIARKLGLRIRSEKSIDDEAYALLDKYGEVPNFPPEARARLDELQDEYSLPGTTQTGRELYEFGIGAQENVHDYLSAPSPNRSEELIRAGVPGIKYKDAGSRGAEGGTRNYVVFDDTLIDIVQKYGWAAAAPFLAAASQDNGG